MTSLTRARALEAWRAAFREAAIMTFADLSHEAHAGALLVDNDGSVIKAIQACEASSFGSGAKVVLERIAFEEETGVRA